MAFLKTLLISTLAVAASAHPLIGHRHNHGAPPTVTVYDYEVVTAIGTSVPTPISSSIAIPSSSVATPSSSVVASPTATAVSGVTIVNNMDKSLYVWSTSDTSNEMETLSSGGGSYNEDWRINSDGGGISIKVSTSTEESSVLQFEYTLGEPTIWWDMSSINLDKSDPIVDAGFAVSISDTSCTTVTCAPGDSSCSESYQLPDDVATRSCVSTATFILTIG
ncbi:hypothetical protein N7495_004126 [Penicillium taxi]|uniref:uncharacterized protein n=1 Tax=Penicillium taxi TaxID=168475 RepID=UPI002544D78D|nr:uncharacterized protein N7495_004126 [Penicillium taxi]KAJ5899382.1 hypothetical protein N7495_004126 [Penicillium taxi]